MDGKDGHQKILTASWEARTTGGFLPIGLEKLQKLKILSTYAYTQKKELATTRGGALSELVKVL